MASKASYMCDYDSMKMRQVNGHSCSYHYSDTTCAKLWQTLLHHIRSFALIPNKEQNCSVHSDSKQKNINFVTILLSLDLERRPVTRTGIINTQSSVEVSIIQSFNGITCQNVSQKTLKSKILPGREISIQVISL